MDVRVVIKKHYPNIDKDALTGLARAICLGNCVLEDDWALEQDLKDLGIRIK